MNKKFFKKNEAVNLTSGRNEIQMKKALLTMKVSPPSPSKSYMFPKVDHKCLMAKERKIRYIQNPIQSMLPLVINPMMNLVLMRK